MKSCGVVVEYNPFHNGHKYHLEQAREKSGADVIVAVMSGNFLQRGEPAVIDKWLRTKESLLNGADLVIELPFAYAVQSADYFTRGSVQILQNLKVDSLCFGTDSNECLDYGAFGKFHQENSDKINQKYQEIKNNGSNYPQLMTQVYRELYPEWALDFSSPNHILGMGYAKENASHEKPMMLYPIQRVGNEYHDKEISHDRFASATSIREKVLSGERIDLEKLVPKETLKDLEESELVYLEKSWSYLKYQLIIQPVEQLRKTYQMVEGLEYRLKEAAISSTNFNEFLQKVKSKRYTWTRIQRLCMYVLLQVTQSEIEGTWNQPYLRVLGFNDQGRQFLKEKKKEITYPVITNINKKNEQLLSLDIKAGRMYSLISQSEKYQDYYQAPIYIKEEEK
ncbi:nucleotidyltransferase [Vagococcus hydrophili]|uniref:tRNA(Met) cytidine acetate ligase n=1 Tax=Vagococcus hydrophili TaxID=2714947 RepID=A0A6G8AV39_9ENTE|nr:nucleotidyltransferase [Vagococcus hydrophili]QIL48866.1 nucleotidyltransferase [Vagococcus hydrophili]